MRRVLKLGKSCAISPLLARIDLFLHPDMDLLDVAFMMPYPFETFLLNVLAA